MLRVLILVLISKSFPIVFHLVYAHKTALALISSLKSLLGILSLRNLNITKDSHSLTYYGHLFLYCGLSLVE